MTLAELETRLRPVILEDQPLFREYARRYPTDVCQMTFPNMFLWAQSRSHRFAEIDGHLVVAFRKTGEERKFYRPIGPEPDKIIRALNESHGGLSWMYLDEKTAQKLASSGLPVSFEEDHCDYVYTIADLINLPGTKYSTKRNYIRRLEKHRPELVDLSGSSKDDCRGLWERWQASHLTPQAPSVLDNVAALDSAFDHFEQLGLLGVGVRVQGKLEAIAIGAPLRGGMFDEGFELTSNAYKGLYQYVLHEFAKKIPSSFTLLNREEDVGIASLREAKQGWHPAYLVKKYALDAQAP